MLMVTQTHLFTLSQESMAAQRVTAPDNYIDCRSEKKSVRDGCHGESSQRRIGLEMSLHFDTVPANQ